MPGSARLAGLLALVLGALAAAGCSPYVQGNGVYGEEVRTPAETFTGVQVEDGMEATVVAGAAAQRVVVSGDANLLPYIETAVITDQGSGPVLHVSIDFHGGSGSPTIPPRVVVSLAELRYLQAADDSHATATGVATPLLTLEAHGKSDLLVSGAGGLRVEVIASESAVDAGSYPVSEGALVDLSAGSRAELQSDGPVAGTVRGGCTLDNLLGAGSCAGVTTPPGETATIQCN